MQTGSSLFRLEVVSGIVKNRNAVKEAISKADGFMLFTLNSRMYLPSSP